MLQLVVGVQLIPMLFLDRRRVGHVIATIIVRPVRQRVPPVGLASRPLVTRLFVRHVHPVHFRVRTGPLVSCASPVRSLPRQPRRFVLLALPDRRPVSPSVLLRALLA